MINKLSAFILASMTLLVVPTSLVRAGCDSCMQAAAQQASTQISTSINQITSTTQQSVSLTQTLANSISAADTAITTTLETNNIELRNSLSAASSRISAEIARNTKAMTELSNAQTSALVQALKEMTQARLKLENDMEFNPSLAQPVSGDLYVDRSVKLKEGNVVSSQLLTSLTDTLYEHNNDNEAIRKGMQSRYIDNLALMEEDVFTPSPLLNSTMLKTQQDRDNMKQFLALVTNPIPLRPLTETSSASSKAAQYEVSRKIWNARMMLVQQVLADELISKTGTIPADDWRVAYLEEAEVDDSDKVSLLEALRADVDGRLMTPGWFQNVKQLTHAGVQRELVYQSALRLKLLQELLKKEDHTVRLLSLDNTLLLDQERKRIMQLHPSR